MIENRLVPNINIFSGVSSSMPIDEFSQKGYGLSNLKATEGASFKDVLSGLVSNLNAEVEKPDQLLREQMMGNSDVDIHETSDHLSNIKRAKEYLNYFGFKTTDIDCSDYEGNMRPVEHITGELFNASTELLKYEGIVK